MGRILKIVEAFKVLVPWDREATEWNIRLKDPLWQQRAGLSRGGM